MFACTLFKDSYIDYPFKEESIIELFILYFNEISLQNWRKVSVSAMFGIGICQGFGIATPFVLSFQCLGNADAGTVLVVVFEINNPLS